MAARPPLPSERGPFEYDRCMNTPFYQTPFFLIAVAGALVVILVLAVIVSRSGGDD
ncbi:MAG: hypothetical protein ACJA0P_003738 [Planctomycetota bacterium]|jgi:hypothetical protein